MIGFLADVVGWFADPANWSGNDGIPARTAEHVWLALVPTTAAAVTAIPAGVLLAHRRLFPFLANAFVNVGRAVPSFGILAVAFVVLVPLGFDFRFWPIVIALYALALPPMFTNAYAAVANVPEALVESAKGMGFRERQVLGRIEMPVATPVILAGVEISLVQVVATVPLAAIISGGGGFGQYIVRGFAQGAGGRVEAFAGAILVAALTVIVQVSFSVLERAVLPEGIKRMTRAVERPIGQAA